MNVVERKPVPIYQVTCFECKSKIEYKASEVYWCHITCPVCGTTLWAMTINPVRMEGEETEKVVVQCENCEHSNEAPFPRKDLWCNAYGVYCKSDGFCANWERKRR